MSATVMSEAMVIPSSTESQTVQTTKLTGTQIDEESVKCECCGLTEECTHQYIHRIRERYQGKWICGLCSEAVKDEIVRCERLISTEEALAKHISFCKKFNASGPPLNPAVHLISAMKQILRRSLDSPRSMKSVPTSPRKNAGESNQLNRSESCFPTMTVLGGEVNGSLKGK